MALKCWAAALAAATLLAGGVAEAQPAADFVGINVHLPPDDELDAAQHLGVPWIRIDNNWLTVERRRGDFDWGSLDRVVASARARGLAVFMTIAYAPAWATDGGRDASPVNDVPRAADFAAYVEATVRRYAPRGVTHFGIWNEPNLDHFFEGTVAEYVDRVLVPGAEAVRRACPDCAVLGPDLAGVSGWQGYLEQVMRRAGDRFDILTHHTYAGVPTVRQGWACDDFDHALDIGDDAICFYKPGLRQVLDAAGWDGPVWLTEAGYRGDPWDDARAQARQQATVEYIVNRQRETPWWQATFFYELTDCRPAQPDCEIDGFGLMRRVAGAGVAPSRASWREHFVFKPSFEWLRAYLAAAPPPVDPPPPPMRATLSAARLDPAAPDAGRPGGPPSGREPILDTRWWDAASCVLLEDYEVLSAPRAGPADLSARVCALWHAEALHLGVEVVDQTHTQDAPFESLWQADALQVAIDVLGDGTAEGGGYRPDDVEVTVALAGGVTRVRAEHGGLAGLTAEATRIDDRTVYALRLPLPGLALGGVVRFSALVNDADGGPRKGWLAFTPGIGRSKDPDAFGQIILLGRAALPAGEGPPEGPEADAGRPPPPPPETPDGGLFDLGAADGTPGDAEPPAVDRGGGGEAEAGVGDAQAGLDATPGTRADAGGAAQADDAGGCAVAPGAPGGRAPGQIGLLGALALLGLGGLGGARRRRRRA